MQSTDDPGRPSFISVLGRQLRRTEGQEPTEGQDLGCQSRSQTPNLHLPGAEPLVFPLQDLAGSHTCT